MRACQTYWEGGMCFFRVTQRIICVLCNRLRGTHPHSALQHTHTHWLMRHVVHKYKQTEIIAMKWGLVPHCRLLWVCVRLWVSCQISCYLMLNLNWWWLCLCSCLPHNETTKLNFLNFQIKMNEEVQKSTIFRGNDATDVRNEIGVKATQWKRKIQQRCDSCR